MAATTITNIAAYLKRYYVEGGKMLDLLLADTPLLGLITKNENAGGEVMRVPVNYLPTAGGSNTYATAVAGHIAGTYTKFDFNWANKYQPIYITDDAIRDSRSDKLALAKVVDTEMESAMYNHRDALSAALVAGTGNALAQISGVTTGASVTLTNKSDARKFKIGDVVVASAGNGDLSAHTQLTGSMTLTAVNYVAGTLTGATHWDDTITSVADGSYLFLNGSFKGGVPGVNGWCPTTAPTTGDSFGGIDRSTAPQLLAGSVYDGSGETIRSAINNACAFVQGIMGARPTHLFINPIDAGALINSAETAMSGIELKAVGGNGRELNVGYSAIQIATPAGMLKCVLDRYMTQGYPLLAELSAWSLESVGPLAELQDFDGLTFRRAVVANGDSWEAMIKTRWSVACKRPFANARIKLAS